MLTGTVAVVPWILGGAISPAILVLQTGVMLAAVLALLDALFSRRLPTGFPRTCLPIFGLALTGVVQLLPLFEHPALEMRHAVVPELAKDLPATRTANAVSAAFVRSAMPAETRLCVSQLVTLALLVMTVFVTVRNRLQVLTVLGGLVVSGTAMTALALSQQFGATDVVIGNSWKISETIPFGCFVNPNNAAGWLLICLSASVALCGVAFSASARLPDRSSGSLTESLWLNWHGLRNQVADMSPIQVLAACATVLLMAGIAATLSRAGIIAALLGLIGFLVSRSLSGRWLLAGLGVALVLCLGCLSLLLFELDTVVLSELRTLKDPVSESTGRLLHWSDTLQSVLDFPLLGSGLGAYRYSTLPFQRRFTGVWFQHADNQYVEVLVETGLVGFVCVAAFGILAVMLIRRAFASVLPSRPLLTESADQSLRGWLASAIVLCISGLAGAAFFDFGISLPSLAASFVVLVVVLERVVADAGLWNTQNQSTSLPASAVSQVLMAAVWVSTLCSSIVLFPDVLAAAEAYPAMVTAERLINRSELSELMDSGDECLADLNQALVSRADDIEIQRLQAMLLELMFRVELIRDVATNQNWTPEQQQQLFVSVNLAGLVSRAFAPDVTSETLEQMREQVRTRLEKYAVGRVSERLLQQSAFVPTVGADLALLELFKGDQNMGRNAMAHVRFSEPHDARSLYVIGQSFLRTDYTDDALACWQQSLAASELFRSSILGESSLVLGEAEAFEHFLPDSYEACANAAVQMQSGVELKDTLLRQAERLWEKSRPRMTESVVLTRAAQLEATGSTARAADWLAECLKSFPENVRLRKRRAELLERFGDNGEAYDEWIRIGSFDSGDPDLPKALERLARLPPAVGDP